MRSVDLCIVGAGPGGSAAAITASRAGLSVLVLDKDRFPRHKVCGEFISFESVQLLTHLLGEPIAGERIESVRLFRDRQSRRSRLPSAALSVSRYRFDEALLEAARSAAAEVITGRRVQSVSPIPGHFEVITEQETFRARQVINAAGRWSELRADKSISGPRWIGVKRHFREADAPRSTDLYFFPGGYCGVQPIGNGQINVSALLQADIAASIGDAIAQSLRLAERAEAWTPCSEAITTAPIVFGAPQPLTNRMFNVGDAAAFIDPFLGDGISIALQTGVLAAECAVSGGTERYAREYHRRVAPAIRRAAWLRRAAQSSLAWYFLGWAPLVTAAARITRVQAA